MAATRSMSTGGRIGAALLALAVLAAPLVLGACGADEPGGEPDITGPVAAVTAADDGTTVTAFLIEQGSGGYDKASVRVDGDTAWYRDSGGTVESIDPPTASELQGKTVRVQFTGAVAESYPVQATAGWVVVQD